MQLHTKRLGTVYIFISFQGEPLINNKKIMKSVDLGVLVLITRPGWYALNSLYQLPFMTAAPRILIGTYLLGFPAAAQSITCTEITCTEIALWFVPHNWQFTDLHWICIYNSIVYMIMIELWRRIGRLELSFSLYWPKSSFP